MSGPGKLPASLSHLAPGGPSGKQQSQFENKKKRRWKPGTVALREIRKFQRGYNTLIPKAAIKRLLKKKCNDELPPGTALNGVRRTEPATDAMHEMIEAYIISLLSDAYLNSLHAKRITLTPKDIQLARRIRGDIS
jgi:histone H3/H4